MYSQQFFHIILISVLCTSIGDIPPNWPAAGALVTDLFCYIKVKVKCTPEQTLRLCTGRTANGGSRGIALLFLDHGTRRGEGSALRPGRSLPPGKNGYPLYGRLGGPQDRSGQVRKISSPSGFNPPTVQPVASRYTDYFLLYRSWQFPGVFYSVQGNCKFLVSRSREWPKARRLYSDRSKGLMTDG